MKIFRTKRSAGSAAALWMLVIVALVSALGGTGYAAHRYIITSPKQVAPKVLKQLKGKAGRTGPRGVQGSQGFPGGQGAQGAQGPQGPPGTARAFAQVATGINPDYDANHGFASKPRRIALGKYCVPAPAGVNPDSTAVLVGLSGGSVGFVTQAGPPSTSCRANEFEIWTFGGPANGFFDNVYFNILVP